MSETRFTPEQLDAFAIQAERTRLFAVDGGPPWELSPMQLAHIAESTRDVCRQAAQDARVIEQLRAWLREGNTLESRVPWHIAKRVLAELDRLAPPQRQE